MSDTELLQLSKMNNDETTKRLHWGHIMIDEHLAKDYFQTMNPTDQFLLKVIDQYEFKNPIKATGDFLHWWQGLANNLQSSEKLLIPEMVIPINTNLQSTSFTKVGIPINDTNWDQTIINRYTPSLYINSQKMQNYSDQIGLFFDKLGNEQVSKEINSPIQVFVKTLFGTKPLYILPLSKEVQKDFSVNPRPSTPKGYDMINSKFVHIMGQNRPSLVPVISNTSKLKSTSPIGAILKEDYLGVYLKSIFGDSYRSEQPKPEESFHITNNSNLENSNLDGLIDDAKLFLAKRNNFDSYIGEMVKQGFQALKNGETKKAKKLLDKAYRVFDDDYQLNFDDKKKTWENTAEVQTRINRFINFKNVLENQQKFISLWFERALETIFAILKKKKPKASAITQNILYLKAAVDAQFKAIDTVINLLGQTVENNGLDDEMNYFQGSLLKEYLIKLVSMVDEMSPQKLGGNDDQLKILDEMGKEQTYEEIYDKVLKKAKKTYKDNISMITSSPLNHEPIYGTFPKELPDDLQLPPLGGLFSSQRDKLDPIMYSYKLLQKGFKNITTEKLKTTEKILEKAIDSFETYQDQQMDKARNLIIFSEEDTIKERKKRKIESNLIIFNHVEKELSFMVQLFSYAINSLNMIYELIEENKLKKPKKTMKVSKVNTFNSERILVEKYILGVLAGQIDWFKSYYDEIYGLTTKYVGRLRSKIASALVLEKNDLSRIRSNLLNGDLISAYDLLDSRLKSISEENLESLALISSSTSMEIGGIFGSAKKKYQKYQDEQAAKKKRKTAAKASVAQEEADARAKEAEGRDLKRQARAKSRFEEKRLKELDKNQPRSILDNSKGADMDVMNRYENDENDETEEEEDMLRDYDRNNGQIGNKMKMMKKRSKMMPQHARSNSTFRADRVSFGTKNVKNYFDSDDDEMMPELSEEEDDEENFGKAWKDKESPVNRKNAKKKGRMNNFGSTVNIGCSQGEKKPKYDQDDEEDEENLESKFFGQSIKMNIGKYESEDDNDDEDSSQMDDDEFSGEQKLKATKKKSSQSSSEVESTESSGEDTIDEDNDEEGGEAMVILSTQSKIGAKNNRGGGLSVHNVHQSKTLNGYNKVINPFPPKGSRSKRGYNANIDQVESLSSSPKTFQKKVTSEAISLLKSDTSKPPTLFEPPIEDQVGSSILKAEPVTEPNLEPEPEPEPEPEYSAVVQAAIKSAMISSPIKIQRFGFETQSSQMNKLVSLHQKNYGLASSLKPEGDKYRVHFIEPDFTVSEHVSSIFPSQNTFDLLHGMNYKGETIGLSLSNDTFLDLTTKKVFHINKIAPISNSSIMEVFIDEKKPKDIFVLLNSNL